jgi:hypothetical protein
MRRAWKYGEIREKILSIGRRRISTWVDSWQGGIGSIDEGEGGGHQEIVGKNIK